MTTQACRIITEAADREQFIVICEDRALVYATEADSISDDGAKAIDSIQFAPYQLTADDFAECCRDIGADYMVA